MRDRKILKLVLVYRNPHTPAAEDDLLYDTLEEIMYGRFKCVPAIHRLGHKDSSGPWQAISRLCCTTQSSAKGARAHKGGPCPGFGSLYRGRANSG